MPGWIRTHPYLLVRNSLCGKRKQWEAVLNHSYGELFIPKGLWLLGRGFLPHCLHTTRQLRCVRWAGLLQKGQRAGRAADPAFHSPHAIISPATCGKAFLLRVVRQPQGSRRNDYGLEIIQAYFKVTCLSFQVLLNNTKWNRFALKVRWPGLMKMDAIF